MSISDFEVLEKIGDGTYSEVYKALRKSDGKHYALKKVRFDPLSKREKANALTEVRVLASITHPNIVAYKEAFVHADTLCIVMELADGGDLLRRITECKRCQQVISEAELWNIFIQVTQGLDALHKLGILHRDLKSANIFLCSDGHVKVGDLNVAKIVKNGLVYTQTGTPYYASPEIWKDQPYDVKSDIWSLGCVMYEAACGKPPFQGANMKKLYRKVVKGKYKPLPSYLSPEFVDLVSRLLRVNPNYRPICEFILELPVVRDQRARLRDPQPVNSLRGTIYLGSDLNAVASQLPPPTYTSKSPKDKTPSRGRSSHKQRTSERVITRTRIVKVPRFELVNPLRDYSFDLSRKANRSGDHISRLSPHSPFSQDTMASRIKALYFQFHRPSHKVVPRSPLLNRGLSRPGW